MNKVLERYKRDLTLRGYSEPTYKNYLLCIKQFLVYYDQPIEQLDCESIKDYLYYLLTEKNASDSKVRQVYSAMKYFYTQTLSVLRTFEFSIQTYNNIALYTLQSYNMIYGRFVISI